MYKKTVLDNGIRIISYNMPDRDSFSLGIWIDVGSRNEEKGKEGAAHLLEHMLFKGSRTYSGRQIKEMLEGAGGSLNGFTSEELTCYLVKIPSEFYATAVKVFSDMVLNPLIKEEELRKEKGVIIEEIKMYKDLPQAFVYELMDGLLWPDHPLGKNVTGTEESVARLTRGELFDFKDKFYSASNIVIAMAGRLKQAAFVREIADNSKGLRKSGRSDFLRTQVRQNKIQIKILNRKTEQSHLVIGFHGLSRTDPDRHKLSLLSIILGGNMSSRLFNEVREERGLAYEIGTLVKRFKDTGAFLVHAGIDNRKVTKTIEVILNQIYRTKRELVREDELKRAKDFYIGQLKLALEDTLDHMMWIGESTTAMDRTFTPDEIYKEVSAIGLEDLRGVAERIFVKERLNIALIGPLASKEKEINECAENTGN